jgi:hypothetical protein
VLDGNAARLPESVLEAVRQSDKALAALDHLGMLPAREGQREVVEAMLEWQAGDRHRQLAGVGKIRERHPSGLVALREEDLLGWPGQRPPLPDPPLQRPQHAVEVAGMAVLQMLEDRRRQQIGVGRQ